MNKLIFVGMNPKTRHLIPWDADAEIWTLNEAPMNAWLKRWDVLFQIHPRWDWDRSNNLANPNYPYFVKGINGDCMYCKGEGKAIAIIVFCILVMATPYESACISASVTYAVISCK